MSWESRPRRVRLARSGLPDTAVRPSGLRYMPLGGRRRVRSGWWRYWDPWASFFPGPGRAFRGREGRGCHRKEKGASGAKPKERVGGGARPALAPHLSLGVSSIWLSLTHCSSSLFKFITNDTGDREGVRKGQGPPTKNLACPHPLSSPWTPTSLLCPFGPPAAEPVCPSRWSDCASSSKSSNTSPGWGSACQAAGGATPEAGATQESGPRAGSSERRG